MEGLLASGSRCTAAAAVRPRGGAPSEARPRTLRIAAELLRLARPGCERMAGLVMAVSGLSGLAVSGRGSRLGSAAAERLSGASVGEALRAVGVAIL